MLKASRVDCILLGTVLDSQYSEIEEGLVNQAGDMRYEPIPILQSIRVLYPSSVGTDIQ
jgi:hypothetical protein